MPRTYTKVCKLCNAQFLTGCWDKKYCTRECKLSAFTTGFADYDCGYARCKHCGVEFKKKHLRHVYCSDSCKATYTREHRKVPTEQQYHRVSGDWRKYFARLCAPAKREALTPDLLLSVLAAQGGRCALTGVELTCILKKGERTWTNASIDRIIPGAPYTLDNIRLICARINVLRGNMQDIEFVHWCRLVVTHYEDFHAEKPQAI